MYVELYSMEVLSSLSEVVVQVALLEIPSGPQLMVSLVA